MVVPEALPFAKSGGLGDVGGMLPRALARLQHDVTLVLPRYRGVGVTGAPVDTVAVTLGAQSFEVPVHEQTVERGLRVWLIDQPAFFDREHLYGDLHGDYVDNPLRFALLSKAALACAVHQGLAPDVVHAHDWQTGLVPVYLRTEFSGAAPFARTASIFTIHNLAYQGLFDRGWIPELGLPPGVLSVDGLEYWQRGSLLKAGINYSDWVTTVSPRYALEIQQPTLGFGFEGIIRSRADALTGIVNGIDTEKWDPASDAHLPKGYAADRLDDKLASKRALLERFGLPVDDVTMARPVIGMVSRMVDQKGLDLISAISPELPHLGASIVVAGTGEPAYERMWRQLAETWPDRIGVNIGYEESLAHLVTAGSDLWLMPSHFEPCGLSQMYSQRYGTLPLVRATGGLDDTVENCDLAAGTGTGFKFHDYLPSALLNTVRWALTVYQNRPLWRSMQQAAMQKDFSWARSARAYAEVYRQALARRPAVAARV